MKYTKLVIMISLLTFSTPVEFFLKVKPLQNFRGKKIKEHDNDLAVKKKFKIKESNW